LNDCSDLPQFVLFYFTKWRNNASKRHADGHANGKKHD
jgi:hypothetical protein